MTFALSHEAVNPHIAALESVFGQAEMPVQWLVVAHDDPRLMNLLSSALAGQSAAVLHVSQDTWDFRSTKLVETIEWALQHGEIKNLVLVGSSQASGGLSGASLVPAKIADAEDANYPSLLAGIHRQNVRSREVQERFAEHVDLMSQIPVVHGRWCDDILDVYGLFYRAESGLFLVYDLETDTFRPLW